MYAVYKNNIYFFSDSIVVGRRLLTRKKEKTDDSFYFEDGDYIKQLDNLDEISDIYSLRFFVTYTDQYFKSGSILEVRPKWNAHYDVNAEDHIVDLFVSARCEENGWEMLDNYSSHKNLKLSECTGFFLKYKYEKHNGVACDNEEIDLPVTKAIFVSAISEYLENI